MGRRPRGLEVNCTLEIRLRFRPAAEDAEQKSDLILYLGRFGLEFRRVLPRLQRA
jgi:hypothetical protein